MRLSRRCAHPPRRSERFAGGVLHLLRGKCTCNSLSQSISSPSVRVSVGTLLSSGASALHALHPSRVRILVRKKGSACSRCLVCCRSTSSERRRPRGNDSGILRYSGILRAGPCYVFPFVYLASGGGVCGEGGDCVHSISFRKCWRTAIFGRKTRARTPGQVALKDLLCTVF